MNSGVTPLAHPACDLPDNATNTRAMTQGNLASCRLFIIHADPVLGSTLASACEHRGARIVGIHRDAESALQAFTFHGLAHDGDLMAILDSQIEDAARIAQRLAERGVPYLVIAAPGDPGRDDLSAAAVVAAPATREDLMGAVSALCQALGRS
jgi:hypothetical protein